jgi:hypothetical protein
MTLPNILRKTRPPNGRPDDHHPTETVSAATLKPGVMDAQPPS